MKCKKTNAEKLASKAADKYTEGSLSMSADQGHEAYQDGYLEGFSEAQLQMYQCALLMPKPHPTMYWLQKLNEWAAAPVDTQVELKWKDVCKCCNDESEQSGGVRDEKT